MIMLILMTAALAAAEPAPTPAGSDAPKHEKMKCCDCCKDMAGKHEGHAGHDGR